MLFSHMSQHNKNIIKFYSQHGEDFLLWEYFDYKEKGFYVEVGAFDGRYVSNTYSFEQQGWTGICIEPHPVFYTMCEENRKGSICINRACVGGDQQEVVLQVDPTGLFSGLAKDSSREEYVGGILENKQLPFEGFQAHPVKASKLDDILLANQESFKKIDFISIDVEGTEIDVLEGFSLDRYSPEVIIVEANSPDHQERLRRYLEERKYFFARKLGVNLFFVNSPDRVKKMRDIEVRCSIEKQVHPLGEEYSVDGIASGLHIDEIKDNLIAGQKVEISQLKNVAAWQKRKMHEQAVKIGQITGENEWLQKRYKEQKKKQDELWLASQKVQREKQESVSKYNELQRQYSELQKKFNQLSLEPVVSRYIRLKKYVRGHRTQDVGHQKPSLGEDRKKVIVNAQYGLGNRLRALGSAQLLAQKTGRDFVLVWIPDIHCQASFSDLFANKLNVVDSLDKIDLQYADVYNYMDSEEGSEKNKFINHETGHDIYVKSAFVLNHKFAKSEDINQLLRLLEPVPEIQAIVNQYDVHDRIGLHVREGGGRQASKDPWDNALNWSAEGRKNLFYWRDRSTPQVFMKEIDRLLGDDPCLQFFLAADSEEIYEQFLGKYKDKILYLKRDLYDRSVDQQKYALADILLLSRTKYILGSYWSSFSEIAQRFGGNEIKYSGKDF